MANAAPEAQTNCRKIEHVSLKLQTTSIKVQKKTLLLIGNYNPQELLSLVQAGYIYTLVSSREFTETPKLPVSKKLSGIILKDDFSINVLKCVRLIKKKKFHLHTPILFYTADDADTLEIRKKGVIDEVITNIYERHSLKFKLQLLGKVKKLFLQKFTLPDRINSAKSKIGYIGKRFFDTVISLLILVTISPLLVLIALAIKLESRGPIFYAAHRAGRHYKIFPCLKFRTMVVGADKLLDSMAHLNQYQTTDTKTTFIKLKNDPRITRIGNFLRNTSLDELPQLINVLLGHMSLVGNRPLPLYEAANLTDDYNSNRFCAAAGLTGLWQVMKRGNEEMSVEERIDLDIQYAKNASPLVDFWILLRTPFAMIQKTDA